jgi:hypothetical protein
MLLENTRFKKKAKGEQVTDKINIVGWPSWFVMAIDNSVQYAQKEHWLETRPSKENPNKPIVYLYTR